MPMHSLRAPAATRLLPILASIILAACGGGGGGGGGGSGAFTLSATSAEFDGRRNQLPPDVAAIAMTVTGSGVAAVGAAFPSGQVATWLTVDIQGSLPDFQVLLQPNTTNLPAGHYTATVIVGTGSANADILSTREISVVYDVVDSIPVSTTNAAPSLVLGSSVATAAIPVNVAAPAGTAWTMTSDAPWLVAPGGSLTGPIVVNLTASSAGLGLGSHAAHLQATSTADPAVYGEVDVTLNVVAPTFTATPAAPVLGGSDGLDPTATPVSFSLDTGTNSWPWTATLATDNGVSWLVANALSGTVSATAAGATLDVERDLLAPGTYTGQLHLSATVQGQVVQASVPVTLNFAGQRLFVPYDGIALSKFPSRQVLTRTMPVTTGASAAGVAWSASANVPWLAVTSGGFTGDDLVITANPAGLATDVAHVAEVTLSSADPAVERDEKIRVSLWVGATDPADVTVPLAGFARSVVANPVEPLAYAASGPGGMPTDVQVYNVHTGALVATYPNVDIFIGAMAISSDGRRLFVEKYAGALIHILDALTGQDLGSYTYPPPFSIFGGTNGLVYLRPNGHPVLWSDRGVGFMVESGARVPTAGFIYGPGSGTFDAVFGASPDSRHLAAVSPGNSGGDFSFTALRFNTLGGDRLTFEPVGSGFASGVGSVRNVCVSGDGARVYLPAESQGVSVFGTAPLGPGTGLPVLGTLPAAANTAAILAHCGWNNAAYSFLYAGGGEDDVVAHDAAGTLLDSVRGGAGNPYFFPQMTMSGDLTRVISARSGPGPGDEPAVTLNFVAAPLVP